MAPLDEHRFVIYQLCRAGERFAVGDGPVELKGQNVLTLGRGEGRNSASHYFVDDRWMSSNHASLTPVKDHFVISDVGSTNGVLVNGRAIAQHRLQDGDIFETGRTFWLFKKESRRVPLLKSPFEFGAWATWNGPLARQVDRLIRRIHEPHHVLLEGPPGVGKGFLARSIHLQSKRPGRLIHLNCGERSEERLRTDLFGDESQESKIRGADLGTLYLENADLLSESLQNKLARTLTRGAMSGHFGGPKVSFDVRVVATCQDHHDIESERLLEVLSHHRIHLPGLKERACDLGLLVDDFLARARGAMSLSRDACRAVMLHQWRLNVRAMACVIESAAVLADVPGTQEPTISLAHLPFEVVGSDIMRELMGASSDEEGPAQLTQQMDEDSISQGFMAAVEEVRKAAMMGPSSGHEERPPSAFYDVDKLERSYAKAIDPGVITKALAQSHGNVSAAARRVGKPRALMMKWIKEFDIDIASFRDS